MGANVHKLLIHLEFKQMRRCQAVSHSEIEYNTYMKASFTHVVKRTIFMHYIIVWQKTSHDKGHQTHA